MASMSPRPNGLIGNRESAGWARDYTPARTPPRLELRCTGCGYGAVTSATPNQCPMCGGLDWDFDDWRPFSSRGVESD
jgi:rubrerythrin